MRYSIAGQAEKIVNDCLEIAGAPMTGAEVSENVFMWYTKSQLTDPYQIASLVLKFGNKWRPLNYNTIEDITYDSFPELLYNQTFGISIEEIEMAEMDAQWR
jgi:hypothetical protein